MTNKPGRLQPNEWAAITELESRLRRELSVCLASLWLFGSKARGDSTTDSDIDVLIVLDNVDSTIRDRVRLLAARVSLEHDVLLNTHILDSRRWAEMARRRATLWQNVQHDGIALVRQTPPS